MRRTLLRFVPVLLILVWSAAALLAQDARAPKRPRLGDIADTNDADNYYDHGVEMLEGDPGAAAGAFYWASRLDPGSAEALYARRVAGLMSDEHLLVRYMEGNPAARRSRDARRLDTLEYRARKINPFFPRELDRTLIVRYIIASYNEYRRRTGQPPLDPSELRELNYDVGVSLRFRTSLDLRALLAASEGRLPEALDLFGKALVGSHHKPWIRRDRAHIFVLLGTYDSALVELHAALTELRERDTEHPGRVYESKEQFEHAIAVIHERRGDVPAAREAYGRALQENLAYYPAHHRLGTLALVAGDTAAAVAELQLAVDVAPDETAPRLTYGALLAQIGRRDEALTHLRRAAELEPYYAMPHYLLGRAAELLGNREMAIESYQAFLVRASQRDRRRAEVIQRIVDLGP